MQGRKTRSFKAVKFQRGAPKAGRRDGSVPGARGPSEAGRLRPGFEAELPRSYASHAPHCCSKCLHSSLLSQLLTESSRSCVLELGT